MPPENQTWPPPPDTPEPLTEHDSPLTALVCAPATKPPLSRLRLVRDLRKETGLQLRQCQVFVNSFCDRNAILLPIRGPIVWGGCLISLIQLAAAITLAMSGFLLERSLNAAPTHAARFAIRAEREELDLLLFGITFVCISVNLIFGLRRAKQLRRDVAYARDKMARQLLPSQNPGETLSGKITP
jgi:hypothetical protein